MNTRKKKSSSWSGLLSLKNLFWFALLGLSATSELVKASVLNQEGNKIPDPVPPLPDNAIPSAAKIISKTVILRGARPATSYTASMDENVIAADKCMLAVEVLDGQTHNQDTTLLKVQKDCNLNHLPAEEQAATGIYTANRIEKGTLVREKTLSENSKIVSKLSFPSKQLAKVDRSETTSSGATIDSTTFILRGRHGSSTEADMNTRFLPSKGCELQATPPKGEVTVSSVIKLTKVCNPYPTIDRPLYDEFFGAEFHNGKLIKKPDTVNNEQEFIEFTGDDIATVTRVRL